MQAYWPRGVESRLDGKRDRCFFRFLTVRLDSTEKINRNFSFDDLPKEAGPLLVDALKALRPELLRIPPVSIGWDSVVVI